jgi:cell shape-determining protein MreC
MSKPKFIKEIEKFELKERAKCWRWYIRVYWELDHKPMVELESLETVVKELHKLEEENKKLKEYNWELIENHKKDIAILCEENKKLKEEVDELDRINHNLNAKLSDLYDVKQILRDIVININRLDKLKEIVFKYDARPGD